jgi:hypothetical protein
LYSLVLCEAVTMTPAAQPSSDTPAATNGVGTKSPGSATWQADQQAAAAATALASVN